MDELISQVDAACTALDELYAAAQDARTKLRKIKGTRKPQSLECASEATVPTRTGNSPYKKLDNRCGA